MRTTSQTVGRTRRQRLGAVTSVFALVLAALIPAQAMAAESTNLTGLSFPGSDVIYNYDFTTTSGASYQTVAGAGRSSRRRAASARGPWG